MSRERAGEAAPYGRQGRWVACWAAVVLAGCAAGPTGPGRDASLDGSVDGGSMDSGPVTTPDSGPPDAGSDGGPITVRRTCESCEDHDECAPGAFCVSLTVGGRACVPGCNPDIPSCPRAFSCVLDIASGVDSTVCLPIGGACCVDQDADTYGQGVGCMGTDCDDADEAINPGASETCNGIDDDCDGIDDDPPTDCLSGRCSALTDGTYEAVAGADCVSAECASGTTTSCELFTCEDGGAFGTRCATTCAPDGTDDDLFCIEGAHCDAGACVMDEPNGGMCDEDSDCVVGRCDNGFCCATGTCCSVAADCGPAGTATCDDPARCQGRRGNITCTAEFRCMSDGVEDDSGCTTETRSRDCGLYDPVYCNGATSQPEPVCPTNCTGDSDCVDNAHCEFVGPIGYCLPDRVPGGVCSRPQDCQDGLFCADGVCCTSACVGTCRSCNLAGSAGTCENIPAGQDPQNECAGLSCATYYTGFGPGEDICYARQPVSDTMAQCNGGGACTDPATLCELSPRGATQIDCDNNCQAPVAGTCTGATPGMCRNLDSPSDTVSCGLGICRSTVQRCVGGTQQSCTPAASPVAETCNGLDDNCNGTPDDGPGASLCAAVPNASTYSCSAATCSFTCVTGYYDVDGSYANGCECQDDAHGNVCSGASSLGSFPFGSAPMSVAGRIVPAGEEDWFSINFPPAASRGPSQGNPQIRLTGAGASNFVLDVFSMCGTSASCGSGGNTAISHYSFLDDQSTAGVRQWSGPHSTPWPSTIVFRVRRLTAPTSCAAGAYTLTISR